MYINFSFFTNDFIICYQFEDCTKSISVLYR